jgi:hypothetical protein
MVAGSIRPLVIQHFAFQCMQISRDIQKTGHISVGVDPILLFSNLMVLCRLRVDWIDSHLEGCDLA